MYYFAYGSNISRRQMRERCPRARPRFTATLPDYKLMFAGWSDKWQGGVATIRPCKGAKVIGAIYDIDEKCLRALDKCEGYPTVYGRMNVLLIAENGHSTEALTYIMNEPAVESQPSEAYLAVIQQGYQDWRLPVK